MNREQLHALKIVAALEECYGKEVVLCSGSVLKRGTVYVVLGRLEEQGWLKSREEEVTPDYIGIPRRLYSLSERGQWLLNQLETRVGNDPTRAAFAAPLAP